MTFYRSIGKRAMDLGLVVPVVFVLTPVGLVLAALIRLKLGAPVLFRQPRPGRDGRVFELIKFRTMSDARGADGEPLPDEERLSPFGNRLRRLSLDELPTLWNVVRGDMSLVGPRPLLVQYLERYTPEQRRRHEVVPGVTGWAQILWRTALQVLRRRGISAEGHATMPEFMGSNEESAR